MLEQGEAELELQQPGLELGDTILILGGDLNGTVAKIYGTSEDRFTIQAKGDTSRVIHIPLLVTEDYQGPDPDLGINEISLLEKAVVPGFVNLVEMHAGDYVEALQDGKRYGEYKITSINEEEDSAVFEDSAGGETNVVFGFTGIPRDLPFEVLRVKEQPTSPANQNEGSPEAGQEEAPAGLEKEENLEEEAEELEEQAEEGEGFEIEFGETVQLAVEEEVKQLSSADRLYPDVYQRSEMFANLIRMLPQPQQKDAIKLQEVRRLVEMMLIMRNDVVRYGKTGEPRGIKQTTVETLAELMKRPHIPLSRKVATMKKMLYLDRHWEHPELDGPEGDVLDEEGESTGLVARYLTDLVKEAAVVEESFKMDTGEVIIGPMPKHYMDMEKYKSKIQTPYLLTQGESVVQHDEEVFRNIVPGSDEEMTVLGLQDDDHKITKSLGEVGAFNPPNLRTTDFAVTRLLKSRIGRFLSGERERVIESGEAPSYENILVFPLTTLRDLGPIRSGSLAQDVSLGMMRPRLMNDILEEYPVEESPDANSILNLGVKGNILGNVTIKDWLSGLQMVINGGGDAYTLLQGYGLSGVEFSKEQFDVIQTKIEQRLAALKVFMKDEREKAASALANLKFEANPVLADADAAALLSRLEGEPELLKVLEDVREFMGELAGVDSNWFSHVFLKYPDFTIAVLGQQAAIVARERQRFLREQYLEALHKGFRAKMKEKLAGKPPVVNKCIHVEELAKARKAGHVHADEPGDITRMKLLIKFFNRFRGQTKDDWVWCNVCKNHLICGHEFLQLQEFLRPKEQEVLHKELLLKYSGGAFAGKFICKVCGQAIAELDFDTSIEFDDEGRPMMGRSVMVDKDALEEDEIEGLLTGPAEVVEELNFGTPELNFYYKTVKRVAELVGVNPEQGDYRKMVSRIGEYMSTIPPREVYARLTAGKKADDYDVYRNSRLIAAAGATLLLNVQTRIPDYIVYYSNSECRRGLFGYPLEAGENFSGVECIISTLAGVNDREAPWNLTGLQGISDYIKRAERLTKLVKGLVDEFSKSPAMQTALKKKRDYQQETLGYIGTDKKDILAKTFRPIPYVVGAEEAAEEMVVAAAADPKKKATAWIRLAHGLAKRSAALNPDSPYTETTCCLHELNDPSKFWREKAADLPALEPRELGAPPYRSKTLTTTFYTEKPELVEGKLNPAEYYKLFMRVCYQGPNKGLGHELGLGDRPICSLCGLQFSQNPSLTSSKENDADIKASLESQGIVINEQTFLELLQTSQQKSFIPTEEIPAIPRAENTFTRLAEGTAPLDGWKEMLRQVQLNMSELGASPSDVQIAQAADVIVGILTEKEAAIRMRIKDRAFRVLESLTRRTPRECGEAALAYLVVPFQRWLTGVQKENFRILDSYEVSKEVKADLLDKGLLSHLQPIGNGSPPIGLIRRKILAFVKEMSEYCKNVFPTLRAITTPGGRLMVNYLLRAYIMGSVQRLLDPHHRPDEGEEEEEVAPDFKTLYTSLGQALTKFTQGSSVPSEEEIRTMLEQRAEAEKQKFLNKLDRMTKERRQVELTNKKLGLGDWAVGGTKAIRQYDDDRYEAERQERMEAGLTDWDMSNVGEEGRAFDMFGFVAEEMNERDGGYDVVQEGEDDF